LREKWPPDSMSDATAVTERERDRLAIVDAVERLGKSTWWSWDDGSRMLFHRWPAVWQREARDGAIAFHLSYPKPCRRHSSVPITEDWIQEKDIEKLSKLLRRRYITACGPVLVTIPRFPVMKGSNDIRVVWDLKKNGVNETVYTPSFQLATQASYHRTIEAGASAGDFDIGEQFPNYTLHPKERPYFGVEIPQELIDQLSPEFMKAGLKLERFMRFNRLPFGWQSSPYFALRMLARALEIVMREPSDSTSAFQWDVVILNLPGMGAYDPARPRVIRLRKDGLTAADIVSFYDDVRVFGPTNPIAEQAVRQATSGVQYLGNQDATRKRQKVSQRPGAWAGSVTYTDQGVARKLITQVKWDKTKNILAWVKEHIDGGIPMPRIPFLSKTGFLLHVCETYDACIAYLQGFYLSQNAWRDDRDAGGYKIPKSRLQGKELGEDELDLLVEQQHEHLLVLGLHEADQPGIDSISPEFLGLRDNPLEPDEPSVVKPVPRLMGDVEALLRFFEGETPIQVIIRPVRGAVSVVYGGGDASGEGFGSLIVPSNMPPLLREGFWCSAVSEASSNYREFRNILDAIRGKAKNGGLYAMELWFGTDNSTAEESFYKGRSSSELLDDMVLELKILSVKENFVVNLVHFAGTRMIANGIDGISRGELHVGSLLEAARMNVLPLHLDPISCSPKLLPWLCSWAGESIKVAEPKDWFYAAQQGGDYMLPLRDETWVWTLAPAAAITALEELGKGRLKRHDQLRGIVLVPTVMKPEWHRRLRKNVDLFFVIKAGSIEAWPACMHESLTVGIYLPLLKHRPWDWKHVSFLVPFGISLSAMYKTRYSSDRDLLCEFWGASRWVAFLPESMVRDLLLHPSWRRFLNISRDRRRT